MAVVARVVAVAVLMIGPWTDQSTELSGWDAERFQEIADRDGDAWVDQPIEYPPGSVIVFDVIAGGDVVATNRAVVVLSALVELATVILLWRSIGPAAAKSFLIFGLPLVPMGLLRLDMLVTDLSVVAALVLLERSRASGSGPTRLRPAPRSSVAFAALVMAGAMIKIWPALLMAAAVSLRRWQAAGAAIAATAAAGVVWLAATGAGLDPVDQVLSLRGATGWHVESLPGSLVALFGQEESRLELNAFRIGSLRPHVVTAGRVFAVGLIASLTIVGARNRMHGLPRRTLALVMLGSVAALIVTAPLLSPQFLLWLTPWGALLIADADPVNGRSILIDPADRPVVALLAFVLVLTGGVLAAFGPSGLDATVPAALLVVRNVALLLLPPVCLLRLR